MIRKFKNFKEIKILGRGGSYFATLFKATEVKYQDDVLLVKLQSNISPEQFPELLNIDQNAKKAGQDMMEKIFSLNIPGIIPCYEIDKSKGKGNYIFYLEYCQRGALNDYPLKQDEISREFKRLVTTIKALHDKNIAHCDIKLDNILLRDNGKVALIDFDNARDCGNTIEIINGSKGYLPPEHKKNIYLPKAFDIWGLGIVLYELYTGMRPPLDEEDQFLGFDHEKAQLGYFKKDKNQQFIHPGAKEAAEVIEKLLISDPKKRSDQFNNLLLHPFFNSKHLTRRPSYHSQIFLEDGFTKEQKITLERVFSEEKKRKVSLNNYYQAKINSACRMLKWNKSQQKKIHQKDNFNYMHSALENWIKEKDQIKQFELPQLREVIKQDDIEILGMIEKYSMKIKYFKEYDQFLNGISNKTISQFYTALEHYKRLRSYKDSFTQDQIEFYLKELNQYFLRFFNTHFLRNDTLSSFLQAVYYNDCYFNSYGELSLTETSFNLIKKQQAEELLENTIEKNQNFLPAHYLKYKIHHNVEMIKHDALLIYPSVVIAKIKHVLFQSKIFLDIKEDSLISLLNSDLFSKFIQLLKNNELEAIKFLKTILEEITDSYLKKYFFSDLHNNQMRILEKLCLICPDKELQAHLEKLLILTATEDVNSQEIFEIIYNLKIYLNNGNLFKNTGETLRKKIIEQEIEKVNENDIEFYIQMFKESLFKENYQQSEVLYQKIINNLSQFELKKASLYVARAQLILYQSNFYPKYRLLNDEYSGEALQENQSIKVEVLKNKNIKLLQTKINDLTQSISSNKKIDSTEKLNSLTLKALPPKPVNGESISSNLENKELKQKNNIPKKYSSAEKTLLNSLFSIFGFNRKSKQSKVYFTFGQQKIAIVLDKKLNLSFSEVIRSFSYYFNEKRYSKSIKNLYEQVKNQSILFPSAQHQMFQALLEYLIIEKNYKFKPSTLELLRKETASLKQNLPEEEKTCFDLALNVFEQHVLPVRSSFTLGFGLR